MKNWVIDFVDSNVLILLTFYAFFALGSSPELA